MTEKEQELLHRLLLNLFLESPRRKTKFNEKDRGTVTNNQTSSAVIEPSQHQPGGKKHGY